MIRTVLALAAAVVFTMQPLHADQVSEEELRWQRVESAGRARELYLSGDAASKKGDLKMAISCWVSALELKPDSEYTRRCLAKAREQLYKRYKASKIDSSKDPLTAFVKIEELISLVPDKPDLSARLDQIKGSFTPGQEKALEAYQETLTLTRKRDFPAARVAIEKALAFDREAICLNDAADAIDSVINGKWGQSAAGARIPKLLFLHTTWCPSCRKSKPEIEAIKSEYAERVEIVLIDCTNDRAPVAAYSVKAYPTVILYAADGAQAGRWEGSPGGDYLRFRLSKLGVK